MPYYNGSIKAARTIIDYFNEVENLTDEQKEKCALIACNVALNHTNTNRSEREWWDFVQKHIKENFKK